MAHNPDLTDAQLLTLAQDIEEGFVFTAGAVPLDDQEMLPQIFADMTQEDTEKKEVGLIYQYEDKANANETEKETETEQEKEKEKEKEKKKEKER